MRCPKTGFTALKIASLVVGGMAIIIDITAVAYPVWDGIDVMWSPLPQLKKNRVKAYGSLWDFTVVGDPTHKMFYQPAVQPPEVTSKLCIL